MGLCRAGLALAILVVVAPPARAAPGVRLLYQRSPGALDCPDEPTLREAVTAQLGYDPFGEGPLTVTTTIERSGKGLVARIELSDAEGAPMGARELSGNDCAELAPAVELVLGLAVDPLRASVRAAAKNDTSDPWTGTLQPRTQSDDEHKAVGRRKRGRGRKAGAGADVDSDEDDDEEPPPKGFRGWPVGVSASIGVAVALDSGPAPAFAFTLQLAISQRRWSLGLEMRGDLPSSSDAAFGGRVETALLIGLIVPCVRHKIASVCALAAFGAERGDGGGYNEPRSVVGFYAALGGRLAVDIPLPPPLAIRVHADLLAPLTRTELYAGSIGDLAHRLYRTAAVSSSLGLALLAHFP
jgi:hypothetical protein